MLRGSDLFGIGAGTRYLVELIIHISTNQDRKVRRESQQLKNAEQGLRNLELARQYVNKLLADCRRHRSRPEEMHNLITIIADSGPAQTPLVLRSKRKRLAQFLRRLIHPVELSTIPEKSLTVRRPRRIIGRTKRFANSVSTSRHRT